MGRPKLGTKGKIESVRVRLTAADRAVIEKAADGKPLSAFIRDAALKAAKTKPRGK